MSSDDFFSFGDEELGGDFDPPEALTPSSGDTALAVADPPRSIPEEEGEEFSGAPRRASLPRGDSVRGSSERSEPSWGRKRILVVAAIALAAFVLAHVARSALGGGGGDPNHVTRSTEARPAVAIRSEVRDQQTRARANRERAAERHQALRQRAKTRHRARRRRERRAARRQHRADLKRRRETQEAPVESSAAPSVEYLPPEPEAPAPESASAPEAEQPAGDGGELHDGSSSPEFGL